MRSPPKERAGLDELIAAPAAAALLTMLVPAFPGIGYVYLGRKYRAAAAFLLTMLLGNILIYALLAGGIPDGARLGTGAAAAALWNALLAFDAYRVGRPPVPPLEEIVAEDRASGLVLKAWALLRWSGDAVAGLLALALLATAWEGVITAFKTMSALRLLITTQPALLAAIVGGYAVFDAMNVGEVASGAVPGSRKAMLGTLKSAALNGVVIFGIAGLLLAIALPGFRGLLVKSKAGATKGRLQGLRAAVKEKGALPSGGLPAAELYQRDFKKYHPVSASVLVQDSLAPTDAGGWIYIPKTGEVFVNCTHTDPKNKVWAEY